MTQMIELVDKDIQISIQIYSVFKRKKEGMSMMRKEMEDTRGRRYRDICICIAHSLCYKAQTNTPL